MALYTTDDLQAMNPEKPINIIGDGLLIEQGKLLVVGETGAGKSVLAFDIAFCLARGIPLLRAFRHRHGNKTPHFQVHRACKVLYIDTELGTAGCSRRLKQFYAIYGNEPPLCHTFQVETSSVEPLMLHNSNGDRSLDRLDKLVTDVKPDVLILDPLVSFHAVEENSNQMALVLNNLNALQHRASCAVILLHHESDKYWEDAKGGKHYRTGTARVRGHSSIAAWADTVLAIRREGGESYVFWDLKWEKVRLGPRPLGGWVFADFSRMWVEWACSSRCDDAKNAKLSYRNQYQSVHPLVES